MRRVIKMDPCATHAAFTPPPLPPPRTDRLEGGLVHHMSRDGPGEVQPPAEVLVESRASERLVPFL